MKRKLLFLAALVFMVSPRIIGQGGHSVTLSWTMTPDPSCVSPCTLGANVYRGTATGAESSTPLNPSPLTVSTFVDSTVVLGNTYFYVVKEVATSGTLSLTSGPSNEVTATFPNAPSAPSGVQVTIQ